MKFTHLHVHSHYSLLDGLTKIPELIARTKELGMDSIALTDHGSLYGAIEFYQKAKKEGVKPIIGCLPPGHLIHTNKGVKPIEEIRAGDLVLTHKGRFRLVTRTMVRPHHGKLYGVRAASANTVWVTGEHPILAAESEISEPKWIRADMLTHGRKNLHGGLRSWKSYAIVPKLEKAQNTQLHILDYLDKKIYGIRKNLITKIGKFNKYDSLATTRIPATWSINADVAQLFGLFLAEGSYQLDPHGRPTTLVFSFGDHENNLVTKAAATLQTLTKIKPTIRYRSHKHLRELYLFNTTVARYFTNVCGKGASLKYVPEIASRWPRHYLAELLNGLVAGDGHVSKTGQIRLGLKSRDLAWGARIIAISLGYPAKVSKRIYDGKSLHEVTWCPNGKYKRVLENESHLLLPIKEVKTKEYNGLVYNFEVAEDHSYVSDITLHNCEMYIAARRMTDKDPGLDDRRFHLTVLARTTEGYHNLIKLITAAHLSGFYYKPRVDHDILKKYGQGLTALSGCFNGEISRVIEAGNLTKAESLIREYQEIFGKDNFFLEVMPHFNYPETKSRNAALRELGKKTGAKLVATNDIHYCRPDDSEAQDILVSVQTGNRFEDENRLTMREADLSIRSPEEMAVLFPGETDIIENSGLIADSISMQIELGKNKIPPFPTPNNESQESFLRKLCLTGIEKRYGIHEADFQKSADPFVGTIRDRFIYEFEIIKKTGFISYFLVVQDFVNWARNQNIIVGPGRGSAAGSLISYLLNITNIDPIHYNLLFERFLNPERIQMPDIDLDFADTRRDEVIDYVQKKYGQDHVAQIITFGTMAARAAIRDTGRALGMSYGFCDQIAKLIPFNPTQGMKEGWLIQCLDEVQELKALYQNDPEAKRLIDSALKLEGVARHASIHASGVVISPEPLENFVPLQYATRPSKKGEARQAEGVAARTEEKEEVLVTQYDMHGIEDIGLLKMDFLGLRNLSIIERAVELIKKIRGIEIDIDTLPLDDKETYKLFQEAKTTGVFQMESAGMKRYLKELKPTELEDLIAMVALYRPGPMEYLPSYIARKHGKETVTYLHPKLKPILSPTYGIGVYQEQMMQIARDLAGYTLPEADTLRKAIGKKIKSLLQEQQDKLVAGMMREGIDRETANAIWELFPAFARYGFNRSHAACYALVAYQTGYLKAHFPAEYMAALMTAEGFEVERVAALIDEAKLMGIEVLAPDLNESFENFTVVNTGKNSTIPASPRGEARSPSNTREAAAIRFGISAIKNVGSNIVEAIIETRKSGGKFNSLVDFIERIPVKDLNKKSIESLAKSGALDCLAERNLILQNMDLLLGYARDREKRNASSQTSLFGLSPEITSSIHLLPAEPASKKERLQWEKELLGLYVTEHPLTDYALQLKDKAIPIRGLGAESVRGRTVSIGGIISEVKKILTKKGDPMLFVTMEDLSAKTEVLVFPSIFQKNPEIWQQDKILLVSGKVSDKDGEPKVLCDQVSELI